MPIERPSNLRPIDQGKFGDIAFEVVRQAYLVQRELGIFFDECIYRNALRLKIGAEAQTEVRIGVRFENFSHEYFLDLLVSHAAVFELKSVESIVDVHRSQLLNYLLLCGLHHGKLINFGHGALQHEFVNATLTQQERTTFEVQLCNWHEVEFSSWMCDFVADVGTCLDTALYEKAACYFWGEEEQIRQWIDIPRMGRQRAMLAAPDWAFRVTTLAPRALSGYAHNMHRFLAHTKLIGIHWVNISKGQLRFETIHK